jgi:hypothetical protein
MSSSYAILVFGGSLAVLPIAVLTARFIMRSRHLRVQRTASEELHGRQQVVHDAAREEQRHSPRPWGPPVEVKVSNSPLSGKPWPGWVVNRSLNGVCWSSAEAIPVGTVLSIRATVAPENIPWTRVEVKHCKFKVNRWLIGGQFLETVPIEVLRLFGYQ